jgi:LysM repeat protein
MCGASLEERSRLPHFSASLTPPVMIFVVLVAVILVGVSLIKPWKGIKIAAYYTPTPTATPTGTPFPTSTPTPTPSPTPTLTPTPQTVRYMVQRGDTLEGIARRFGTTVEAIKKANNIQKDTGLLWGVEIVIPISPAGPGNSTPTPTSTVLAIGGNPPTPDRTPTSTPTSTATAYFRAPTLLSPADEERVEGEVVTLQWSSVGILGEDEAYLVSVRYIVGENAVTQLPPAITIANSYRVPAGNRPSADASGHLFEWDVSVVQLTGTTTYVPLTPPSDPRTFYWY